MRIRRSDISKPAPSSAHPATGGGPRPSPSTTGGVMQGGGASPTRRRRPIPSTPDRGGRSPTTMVWSCPHAHHRSTAVRPVASRLPPPLARRIRSRRAREGASMAPPSSSHRRIRRLGVSKTEVGQWPAPARSRGWRPTRGRAVLAFCLL
jgi:hypothetical protein